ncbi:hypothetical protein Cflav_PD5398 [Pedosphaera parvula Ellin514]|uniref:Uncharacterized protein n=1 Tax=Pedosphaera parvula (strain Ellin514) TaxID=320771 RepID=B9XB78_PEDPL|nr:hypothetical protein Cflav_PD5398 [Pedosphaera parvula Ellin514]
MPISVRMKKSGVKRVHPRPRSQNPNLDAAARGLWRTEGANYTTGPVGLADPVKPLQSKNPLIVLENNRRRKLASLHKSA